MKETGCEEQTNSRANLWSDEQKSHMRLSLDYENGAERLLSMLDINAVKEVLNSKGKFPEK